MKEKVKVILVDQNTQKDLTVPKHHFYFNKDSDSVYKCWTSIGISPLEIYQKVEEMGFVFPK